MKRVLLALVVSTAVADALAAPAYKGMSYTSFSPTVLSGTGSDQSLVNMSLLGTDTVALNFWWYQDSAFADNMYEDPNRSATMASIEHAIDYIHGLGLKVFLKPMLDIQDGTWRANIEPADPDLWFQNYTNFIGTFADMAEAKDVELFSIGCEFNRLENPSNTQRWTDLITNVRSRYSGPVTYAANWNDGSLGGGYDILPWWDQLDTIGIDAYFPVTAVTNPSLAQMQASWTSRADQLEAWRQTQGLTDKQVIFTEVGLSSYDGSNITPYDSVSQHPGAAADEIEQANGYEALLSVMTQRDWWDGAFWWNWETNPNTSSTTSFTPQHKLAIDVLANYYGGVLPPFPASNWNTSGNGQFGTATNWSNGVPNSVFVAMFDRGEAVSYSVMLNTTNRTVGQLRVGANTVTLTSTSATVRNLTADDWHIDHVNRGIIIGVEAGDVAVVNTTSTFGTLTARAATLGDAAGASGTLNLSNSTNLFNVFGVHPSYWEFIVGRAGSGTLSVTNGARVTVSGPGASSAMGLEAGSSGTATVAGSGSLWSTFIALRVGIEGQASLTVADGGTVSAPNITVGTLGEIHGNGTLTGFVTNNGLVAPGTSPGQLTVNGNYSQGADGELLIELASTSSFDRLQVSGIVTLGGTLSVNLLDGFAPQLGDSFDVLNWGNSFVDAGYTFALPALDEALAWDTSQFNASGLISVFELIVNLSGDYNGDGVVGTSDYTVWRDSLGQTGSGLAADGSGSTPGVPDGVVDQLDYDFWKSHFGETAGAGAAAGSPGASPSQRAVPEPTSLLLSSLGGAGLLFVRRRAKALR